MSFFSPKSLKNLIFRHEIAILFLVAIMGLIGGVSAFFWQQNSSESVRINAMFYLTEQIRGELYAQIQEMIHIERGGEKQLKDELNAYNPLIPKGNELVATLMFEIDNPVLRSNFLGKVGGIEEKIYIKISNEIIKAVPETDVDRTSAEGKASSVQFVHFNFSKNQIDKFRDPSCEVSVSIDHPLYNHSSKLSKLTKDALAKDFS